MDAKSRMFDVDALERLRYTHIIQFWDGKVIKSLPLFALPTVDAVSRGVHDQVRWERDMAIEQLESYGVSLGEKADVVKVVHGHWFLLDECANAGVYCSVCHKKVYKEDYAWCNRKNKLRSNYCPNCGAKMDGDGNG